MRIAIALVFLAAQFAPALHAFHAEEEFAEHCTDGESSTHWCACTLDHDAPECTLCAHATAGAPVEVAVVAATVDVRIFSTTPEAACVDVTEPATPTAPRGPPSGARS